MSDVPRTVITGYGRIGYEPEVPGPLDELIFHATSQALSSAGTGLADVDAVVMACSDLYDGRAISTMTLTASTGSFTRSELRVCDDGLGALGMAVAELRGGGADTILVSAWTKLSDADLITLEPLGAEPAFHRELVLTNNVVAGLRRSHRTGRGVVVDAEPRPAADGAVALVLTSSGAADARGIVHGVGWSTGRYLDPAEPELGPLGDAARRAVHEASIDPDRVRRVRCAGFHRVPDVELLEAVGFADRSLHRSDPPDLELGYAAGLFALADTLEGGSTDGLDLVVAATGLGYQRGYAAVIEGGLA